MTLTVTDSLGCAASDTMVAAVVVHVMAGLGLHFGRIALGGHGLGQRLRRHGGGMQHRGAAGRQVHLRRAYARQGRERLLDPARA